MVFPSGFERDNRNGYLNKNEVKFCIGIIGIEFSVSVYSQKTMSVLRNTGTVQEGKGSPVMVAGR